MNILFVHRTFPGQFKYLTLVLGNNPNYKVVFITEDDTIQINNVEKRIYKLKTDAYEDCNPYLMPFEKQVEVGEAVAAEALKLKKEGFVPDLIYGFSGWGSTLFLKDIYPHTPLISYCEWFGYADGPETQFDGRIFDFENKAKARCANSGLLIDLYSCDAAVTPTQWQKEQFPKEFHNKMKVIHDGIDVETCLPNPDAKFLIQDKNLELSAKDEVVTFGTRVLELYRGFPQFMEAVEILQKKRPNTHFVIAGDDVTCYGPKLENETYKEHMLKKLKLDMNKIHFVEALPFPEYVKLLQISKAHVYLTYPYILSWSILNAMATGCCVIASDTQPVREVIQDNYNGLLFDFHNPQQQAKRIEYALDHPEEMEVIRKNARQTIIEKYDIKKLFIEQLNFLNTTIIQHKQKEMS